MHLRGDAHLSHGCLYFRLIVCTHDHLLSLRVFERFLAGRREKVPDQAEECRGFQTRVHGATRETQLAFVGQKFFLTDESCLLRHTY